MLRLGSSGDKVVELQNLLCRLGYPVVVDGQFGKNTDAAVRAYQTRCGIQVDGVVGPATMSLMNSATKIVSVSKNTDMGHHIVDVARRYIGSYEISDNKKWLGTADAQNIPQELMDVGWQPGWAYCASFAEAVWNIAYGDSLPEVFRKNMTPSVMQSYNNFKKLGLVSKSPIPGSVVLMRHGLTAQGHAGILEYSTPSSIFNIEGNTSPNANIITDREGDGIYEKQRDFSWTQKTRGLWLLGFVNPM